MKIEVRKGAALSLGTEQSRSSSKGYKQTEVGVISEDWEVKSISEFSTCVRGGSPRPAGSLRYFNGDFIPWLTVAALTNISPSQLFVSETNTCLTEEGSHHSRTLEEGTLIIANSGATLGVAKLLSIKCCANDGIAILLDFNKNIDKLYIVYFINSITKSLREVVATGNGQPNLNTELIGAIKIPLPPTKSEQTAIATALSDADALITSLEKLIEKKRAIKQGAMQELLRPKEGWVSDKAKNLALITTGSKNTQDKVDDGNYPFFVRSQTVERINSYSFEGEAILTAGDGVGTGKVFHYINGRFDFHQRVYKISDFIKSIDGKFFYLYFAANFYNRIMQMTAKSSVDSVRMEMIGEMEIPYPTKSEQTRIATILSDMDAEIMALEQRLAKYKLIKQGMMQELLTGRIRLI